MRRRLVCVSLFVLAAAALAGCGKMATVPGGEQPGNATPGIKIERKQFVALTYNTTGGIANLSSQLTVRDGAIQLHAGPPQAKTPVRTATLSKAEVENLLKLLNSTQFPKLAGNYHQPQLFDGIDEEVSLTLKRNGGEKTYTVHNYGDKAPPDYYIVRNYLSDLRSQKFTPPYQAQ